MIFYYKLCNLCIINNLHYIIITKSIIMYKINSLEYNSMLNN